ncbi:MAG: hypothetical protein JWL94_427 [Microbacteriaceae bacterium]|jgi:hypothetical protein|nr:hypothetical protein [Microbacteriaceae bacterium]HEV7956400.1 DUF3027 domain-containing protein [Marisediminicola sp.]
MPEATPEDFERGRAALLEIAAAETIGAPAGSIDEGDGVVTVYFDVDMLGYPGWRWTASIAHVEGLAPSVLETEMTPGEGSILAPEWVPWVDRLADYRAVEDAAEAGIEDTGDEDDDDLDEEDLDNDVLHAGDLDGVDIDDLDEEEDDDEDDDVDYDDSEEPDADGSVVATVRVDESEQSEPDADGTGEQPRGALANEGEK